MIINSIFSTAIGQVNGSHLINDAKKIFNDNKNLFENANGDFKTTLFSYLSKKTKAPTLNCQNEIEKIKKFIELSAFNYMNELGFNMSLYEINVENFWLNKMKQGSYHTKHIHFGEDISGCFYVEMPIGSENITFYNHFELPSKQLEVKNYTTFNSKSWFFNPKAGDIFFWNSLIPHEVPSLNFDGIRKSIAFDLKITER